FGERVRSLVPFTREAILFAAQRGIVLFDDDGLLRSGTAGLRGITNRSSWIPGGWS
ncbi:MAG: ABC-three component system Middle Component 3, partial [Chloroflexota bacterium]|nr:ABC-three component system Middle Component 3 [Chloroflexota bacterium]